MTAQQRIQKFMDMGYQVLTVERRRHPGPTLVILKAKLNPEKVLRLHVQSNGTYSTAIEE